jgi:hypothetical protein
MTYREGWDLCVYALLAAGAIWTPDDAGETARQMLARLGLTVNP